MKKDKFNLGTIELGSEVIVSDPCYSLGTWCQGHLTDVKAGKYNAFMNKASFNDWVRRGATVRGDALKLTDEQKLEVLRLGCMKVIAAKERLIRERKKNNSKEE